MSSYLGARLAMGPPSRRIPSNAARAGGGRVRWGAAPAGRRRRASGPRVGAEHRVGAVRAVVRGMEAVEDLEARGGVAREGGILREPPLEGGAHGGVPLQQLARERVEDVVLDVLLLLEGGVEVAPGEEGV